MPIVELDDGTEVEFPDDMSGDEIKAVLDKQYGAQEPQEYLLPGGIKPQNEVQRRYAESWTKAQKQREGMTGAEVIASDPGYRMFYGGVTEPVLGLSQVVSKYLVDPFLSVAGLPEIAPQINEVLNRNRQIEESGRRKLGEDVEGIDPWKLAGGVAVPVNIASKLKVGKSLLDRMATGAATGAAYSISMPVYGEDQERLTETKGEQMLGGGAGGAFLGAASKGAESAVRFLDDVTRPMWFRNLGKDNLSSTLEDVYGKGITKDVKEIINDLSGDQKDLLIDAIKNYKAPVGEPFSIDNAIAQAIRKGIEEGKDPKVFGTGLIRLQNELGQTISSKDYLETLKLGGEKARSDIIENLAKRVESRGATIQDKIDYLTELRATQSKHDYEDALNKIIDTDSEREIVRKTIEQGRTKAQQDVAKAYAAQKGLESEALKYEGQIGRDIRTDEFPPIRTEGAPNIVDTLTARELPEITSPTTFPPIGAYDVNDQMRGMYPYMNRVTDQVNQGDYSVYGRELPSIQKGGDISFPEESQFYKTQDVMNMDELEKTLSKYYPERIFKTDYEARQASVPAIQDELSQAEKNMISAQEGAKTVGAESKARLEYMQSLNKMQDELAQLEKLDNRSLNYFMKYPEFQDAFKNAQRLSANRGVNLPDNPREISIRQLQDIKEYLRQGIKMKQASPGGIYSKEEGAVGDITSEFSDWVGNRSLDWKIATKNYSDFSTKIDQAEFLKRVQDSLKNPSDKETVARFLSAMNDEANLMRKATGYGRYGSVEEMMGEKTPLARETRRGLEAVKQSLLDREMAARLQGGEMALGYLTGGIESKIPNMLNAKITLTNSLISKLVKNKTPEYQQVAARILTSPEEMLRVLQTPETKGMALDIMNQLTKITGQTTGRETGE